MTLILRKCHKDGSSRNNFFYGQVGERVNCPDWNPKPYCGHGLHGLKEGNGDWELLIGDDWLIIDADDQIIDIDKNKCKFNTGVILFRGTAEELSKTDFCLKLSLGEKNSYYWAIEIGNSQELTINIKKGSNYAYSWAKNIGNRDVMIDKIADSESAYYWAKYIGNKDIMIDKITDSLHAYYWARHIGNRDVMMNRITHPEWAYWWAVCIGDENFMYEKVKEDEFWNSKFINDIYCKSL